jgi:urease accessory protein
MMTTITIMTSIVATTIITTTPMLMTIHDLAPVEDRREMTDGEAAALYRLMTWLSPAFPVGGFSYSSGIEWAVEAGDIADAGTLRDWLAAMLAEGSGLTDGIFLAHAHRAVETDDDVALRDVAELAAAFVPSRERQLETSAQGRAFIDISRSAWSCAGLEQAIAKAGATIVYPVAVLAKATNADARGFEDFLKGSVAKNVFEAQGFKPLKKQPAA